NRRTGRFEDLETFGLPRNFRARLDYVGNTVELNLRAQLIGDGDLFPGRPILLPSIPGLPLPPEDLPGSALPPFTSNQINAGRAIDNFFNNGGTTVAAGSAGQIIRRSGLRPSAKRCRPKSRSPTLRRSKSRARRRRRSTRRAGRRGAAPMAAAIAPPAIPLSSAAMTCPPTRRELPAASTIAPHRVPSR